MIDPDEESFMNQFNLNSTAQCYRLVHCLGFDSLYPSTLHFLKTVLILDTMILQMHSTNFLFQFMEKIQLYNSERKNRCGHLFL